MADDVNIRNFPDSGSNARVAFDLMKYLNASGVKPAQGDDVRKFVLDLYAECHRAARGSR